MKDKHIPEKYKHIIIEHCLQTTEMDVIKIADSLMEKTEFRIHGPEHHFLVAAVMMTAYKNYTHSPMNLEQQLSKLYYRTSLILEGSCGFYGMCGNVLGIGAFFSLLKGVTPFSKENYSVVNKVVANCQKNMMGFEGPRCCKRATYSCLETAINELYCLFRIKLPVADVVCQHSYKNEQCHADVCPYFG